MAHTPADWLDKIANLNPDKASGDPAPHKPLFLLTILGLAERGELKQKLPLTAQLAFQFRNYWSVVAHRRRQRPDVRLPFHHLQRNGFWNAFDQDGRPSPDKRVTEFVVLSPDFLTCTSDPAFREQARRILIAKHFEPQERLSLYTLVGLPVPSEDEICRDASYKSPEAALRKGREVRFRLNVVAAYDYTCALTRYRLTTISGASIVDAAHIHQFSDSGNNELRNGLALCKNAHWLFDNGLWTLSDDYKVIVAAGEFYEDGPEANMLAQYHGQAIQLPSNRDAWPNPVHLAWHRTRRFKGAKRKGKL